jgi:hypothetical protein
MSECGALAEWYWEGKTQVLEEKPLPVPPFYHKCHMNCPGIEPGHLWLHASNQLPKPLHSPRGPVQFQYTW